MTRSGWSERQVQPHGPRVRHVFSGSLRHRLKSVWGNQCVYCWAHGLQTVDHAVPLSRGGNHAFSNLRPCCYDCNQDKGDMTEDEYRAHLRHRSAQ